MTRVRSGAWLLAVAAGVSGSVQSATAQTQCPDNLYGVRMSYSQLRELGFTYNLMADDPTGRIESLSVQWAGEIAGQAISGGAGCGDPPCNFACRGDGDLISEGWDFGGFFKADPPSWEWGVPIYGSSGLPAFSHALCNGSTGTVGVGEWVASYAGSTTHASAGNLSGSDAQSCWGECGDPYFVDHGYASTVTKEEHVFVLAGAPGDGNIHLDLTVSGWAAYGHTDMVKWFFWGGAVDSTCIGTPAPLDGVTKVSVDVNVYKVLRDAQGNPYPGSLIDSHSFSGNISTSPYAFTELSGIFAEPDGFTIATDEHWISKCDQGNGDEPYAEGWAGKGAAHAVIELDLEIKDPCIIVISYYNACAAS
jgi:hypothetical protein